ncbi:MAG: transcription antitermination factor NusB [Kiritimatiellia bacterium]
MNSVPPLSNSPERDQACRLLSDWIRKGSIPHESGDWNHCSALTRELVWTCLRHKGSLDAWVEHLSNRPPSHHLLPFLWIGLSQLLLLDGIPDHAAVHETIEAAKRAGIPPPQIGFANALFRRCAREHDDLLQWLQEQVPEKRYSHPQVIVERWNKSFGKAVTLDLLRWNQERSFTYARLTSKGKHLKAELGLPTEAAPYPQRPNFYQLPRGYSPSELPDFDRGAWYIQDPSTAMAPEFMEVKPGEAVLDACAAPGGKTAILAEQTQQVLACDPNPKRCERLRENLVRLGHTDIEIRAAELTGLTASHPAFFDAILLDVPCGNTGVYQRRPDAKWNFRRKMLTELVQLQYQLLTNAVSLLKPGGRLVYSTCSIEEEETTRQIQNWLSQHPDFRLDNERLLLPGEENCDGAYAARLVKQND